MARFVLLVSIIVYNIIYSDIPGMYYVVVNISFFPPWYFPAPYGSTVLVTRSIHPRQTRGGRLPLFFWSLRRLKTTKSGTKGISSMLCTAIFLFVFFVLIAVVINAKSKNTLATRSFLGFPFFVLLSLRLITVIPP